MTKLKDHIEALAKKAAEASKGGDAMHFSQAALNLANAKIGMQDADKAH